MSDSSIIVSFKCIPNELFAGIQDDLDRLSPLRNLHWKSASRAIRTIQELWLNFQSFDRFGEEINSQVPTGLLARPFVHLFFVTGDDNDFYRTTLRKEIKDWQDQVERQKSKEWLIVHLTAGKVEKSKFYQRKSAVIDKVRADFNHGKRDRCIQVSHTLPSSSASSSSSTTSSSDPSSTALAWADLISKLKDAILAAFEADVSSFEEEIRRMDAQRNVPGWNFCKFFLLKEALAMSFENLDLSEDALVQYDELEAAFFQCQRENNLSFFESLGGVTPGDDSQPLLSTTKKPYRDYIISNQISIFDFRVYLFARQCLLLGGGLGRIDEVAQRGLRFVSGLGRTLRESEVSLPYHFVESWIYSACLNIVDQCQVWAKELELEPDSPNIKAFLPYKGELLDLARKQLEKIGIHAGHLPAKHPFTMAANEPPAITPPGSRFVSPRNSVSLSSLSLSLSPTSRTPSPTPPASPSRPNNDAGVDPDDPRSHLPRISRKELIHALEDRDGFDKLFTRLCNQTIESYEKCGRRRFGLKVHASLAALAEHRNRTETAYRLYYPLPGHYVGNRWTHIESELLSKNEELQGKMDMNRERLLSVLAIIRAGVEAPVKQWNLKLSVPGESQEKTAEGLMKEVKELAGKLDKDFAAISFPTFSVKLAERQGRRAKNDDGAVVSVQVNSLLPCPLPVEEVRLKFSTSNDEQVWFSTGPTTIIPNQPPLDASTAAPTRGYLSLELAQIRYSRIVFQYSFRPRTSSAPAPSSPNPNPERSLSEPTVFLPKDREALDFTVQAARKICLDENRQTLVEISTGRNQVEKLSLTLRPNERNLQFQHQDASCLTEGVELSKTTSSIELRGLKPLSKIEVLIPFTGIPIDTFLFVNTTLDYWTKSRPETRRGLKRLCTYPVALPLSVNVQDFFRSESLISRFTVTGCSDGALRVRAAHLSCSDSEFKPLCATHKGSRSVSTLFRDQSSNYVFKLPFMSGDRRSLLDAPPLRFTLDYLPVHEELAHRFQAVATKALSDSELVKFSSSDAHEFAGVVGEAALHWARFVDTRRYILMHEVELPPFDRDASVGRIREVLGRNHRSSKKRKAPHDAHVTEDEVVDSLLTVLGDVHKACSDLTPDFHVDEGSSVRWHRLEIPVDVPTLSVLNVARLSITYPNRQPPLNSRSPDREDPSPSSDVLNDIAEVGEPLPAILHLQPSFRWNRVADTKALPRKLSLSWEVVPDRRDWLVSVKGGKVSGDDNIETNPRQSTRGKGIIEVEVSDPTEESIPISLIPLRPGSLFLPSVFVTPLPVLSSLSSASAPHPSSDSPKASAIPESTRTRIHGHRRALSSTTGTPPKPPPKPSRENGQGHSHGQSDPAPSTMANGISVPEGSPLNAPPTAPPHLNGISETAVNAIAAHHPAAFQPTSETQYTNAGERIEVWPAGTLSN